MTTLQDLEKNMPEILEELEQIARDVSRYKKIRTDMRGQALLDEVKAKITQIKRAYKVYKDDLAAFRNKNFDGYIQGLRNSIQEYKVVYEKLKKFESVTDYYGNVPFSENENELTGLEQQ